MLLLLLIDAVVDASVCCCCLQLPLLLSWLIPNICTYTVNALSSAIQHFILLLFMLLLTAFSALLGS